MTVRRKVQENKSTVVQRSISTPNRSFNTIYRIVGYVQCSPLYLSHSGSEDPSHLLELPNNALGHEWLVGELAIAFEWSLGDGIRSVEATSRPADPAEENVGVLVDVLELLAQVSEAGGVIGSSTGFGENRHAADTVEVLC